MIYRLYSIGHGNRDIDEFIQILTKFQIDNLVDVRTIPYSGTFPHYNREKLIEKLEENKISYLFFGDKLGGRPEMGFSKFVDTPDFKRNIGKLLSQVKNKTAAIMCSELDYMNCHRKFISEVLRKNSVDIKDIDKKGEIAQEEQFSIKQY